GVADGSNRTQCRSLQRPPNARPILSTWGTAVVPAFRTVAHAGPVAARREPPVPAAAHGRPAAEAVHGPPAAVAHERPAAVVAHEQPALPAVGHERPAPLSEVHERPALLAVAHGQLAAV